MGIAAVGCGHIGDGAVRSAVEPAIASRAGSVPGAEPIGEGLRQLLDSAGPGVVAMDLAGRLIYCNPAAERMLGYRATELAEQWETIEILAPGEAERLVAEMQKLCRVVGPPATTRG